MPRGAPPLVLRDEDDARFEFVFYGRRWAVVTLIGSLLTGTIAYTGSLSSELLALRFFGLLSVLLLLATLRNFVNELSLEIAKASGRVSCSGSWDMRVVSWTLERDDFASLHLVRPPDTQGHYLELAPKRGDVILLRCRGLFESTRRNVMFGLGQRLASALHLSLQDRT